MTPEEQGLRIYRLRKVKALINKLLCWLGFHLPYYKYRERTAKENVERQKLNVSPETFMSIAPEHLGYHCRICDMPLGYWRRGSYWLQIKASR